MKAATRARAAESRNTWPTGKRLGPRTEARWVRDFVDLDHLGTSAQGHRNLAAAADSAAPASHHRHIPAPEDILASARIPRVPRIYPGHIHVVARTPVPVVVSRHPPGPA